MINRSLGKLLRCLIGENPRSSESTLHLAEFAYNSSLNQTINTSPFEEVYGSRRTSVTDMAHLPLPKKTNNKAIDMADFMKSVFAQVKSKIEVSNAKYKSAADVH